MKQKGFVTIACGDERYFKLAVNLLLSYKYHSREILPWAIITDRENKYTAQFDDVVMIPELEKSYMSKIQMLIHPPYKENIFIDADCLVYSDINSYFKYMKPGVSHFGYKISLEDNRGWFNVDNIGDWRSKISFKILSHGGIIFFNDDALTRRIYDTCLEIIENYDKIKFAMFSTPADEPIMALSMCVNDCQPIEKTRNEMNAYVFLPDAKKIRMNIKEGSLSFISIYGQYDNWISEVKLLHWANNNTNTALYRREAMRLKLPECLVIIFHIFDLLLHPIDLKTSVYRYMKL